MNNTVKMTFWISQGKVATSDRRGGQMCKIFLLNFLRIQHTKNYENRLIFDSYSKNKKVGVLGSQCTCG